MEERLKEAEEQLALKKPTGNKQVRALEDKVRVLLSNKLNSSKSVVIGIFLVGDTIVSRLWGAFPVGYATVNRFLLFVLVITTFVIYLFYCSRSECASFSFCK